MARRQKVNFETFKNEGVWHLAKRRVLLWATGISTAFFIFYVAVSFYASYSIFTVDSNLTLGEIPEVMLLPAKDFAGGVFWMLGKYLLIGCMFGIWTQVFIQELKKYLKEKKVIA